jgi:hypothetical protein
MPTRGSPADPHLPGFPFVVGVSMADDKNAANAA